MSVMNTPYSGRLTADQRADIATLYWNGSSVRQVAKVLNIPYGRVRGYVEWLDLNPTDLLQPPATGPKILIFDIETSYNVGAYFGGKYKVNINKILRHWHLLCFAYRWYGQDEMGLVSQRQDPNYVPGTENDKHVAVRLHRLMTEADIVIAHYGDRFDIPKANSRFLFNGLGPPSPFQSIDTKSESSRHLGEASNSLADLTEHYGLDTKLTHSGFDLWVRCVAGEPAAWDEMEAYNMQDVEALTSWYETIRPFIGHNGKKKHPNLGHFVRKDGAVCPNCMSERLIVRGWTPHRTQHYEYPTMQCKDCGRYSRQTGVRRTIDPQDRIYAT